MNKKLQIAMVILSIVFVIVIFWRLNSSKKMDMLVSHDALSEGIADRWGGGLPAGYEKIQVGRVDREKGGSIFARLEFEKPVGELLDNWIDAGEEGVRAFDALLDLQLSNETLSEEDRETIEKNRPRPEEDWLSYHREGEKDRESKLALLCRPDGKVIYVAEYQPEDWD